MYNNIKPLNEQEYKVSNTLQKPPEQAKDKP